MSPHLHQKVPIRRDEQRRLRNLPFVGVDVVPLGVDQVVGFEHVGGGVVGVDLVGGDAELVAQD